MANKAAIAKHKRNVVRVKGGSTKISAVKLRNRCEICGRSRGYIRRFKMCRICLRQRALRGDLPGVKKLSW